MILIKKYSNRRLYDTSRSQYITLEELAGIIRGGEDVQVQDAKSGEDLTQSVLAQIILESRGAARLLPATMLMQLIRMEEDALAEFFSYYMGWALSFYLNAKERTTERLSGFSGAFSGLPPSPFGAGTPGEAFSQWFQAMNAWNPVAQQHQMGGWPAAPFAQQEQHVAPDAQPPPHEEDEPTAQETEGGGDEVAKMREELDEIKALLKLAVRQSEDN